jgi:hypothetical protein
VKVLMLVAGTFIAALDFAAFRLLDRADGRTPDESAPAVEPLVDPGTPVLVAEPPNRDVRRLLTKVAREAVRARARRMAEAS